MGYEKQYWANGDLITASKLNHMENGIAEGGGCVVINALVNSSTNDVYINASYNDIVALYNSGVLPIIHLDSEVLTILEEGGPTSNMFLTPMMLVGDSQTNTFDLELNLLGFTASDPDSVLSYENGK